LDVDMDIGDTAGNARVEVDVDVPGLRWPPAHRPGWTEADLQLGRDYPRPPDDW
jgi:hypothetical protein